MRVLRVAVVACAAGALWLATAGNASAETCSYDAGTRAVSATITPGSGATLKVVGGALWFGFTPLPCGDATTTNTDSISVAGAGGSDERLTIDLTGGVMGPGYSSEFNTPEIEIATTLGDATDTVAVIGTDGDDFMAAGQFGLALNNDGDVDVTFAPTAFRMEAYLGLGNDYFNGRGQSGAGLHFLGPLRLEGSDGNDTLWTSTEPDVVHGGAGDDYINLQAANDLATGGAGNDTIAGAEGDDDLDGGAGADSFSAGYGNDVMRAGDGEADTSFNGGPGTDTLYYDPNIDPGSSATEIKIPAGPPPPPPPPPGSCTFDATARTVTASVGAGTSVTLAVDGGAIELNGAACGAATTANTDSIAVTGPAGSSEGLTIDQSGGAFAPGVEVETGTSEIEIAVNLGDAADTVVVKGTTGADTIAVGLKGVALNTDGDVDVTFGTMPAALEARGLGGVNVLTASGGFGAGGGFAGSVAFYAGDSGDTLSGNTGSDTLVGGAGNDTLNGGSGNDSLDGGAGNDSLVGSHDNDTLVGGAGSDSLIGSNGNDLIHADDDEADASISAGGGTDTVWYDAGLDPSPSGAETTIPA